MLISYLADHPEFVRVLAPAIVEHWRLVIPEETVESRIAKLQRHMNRDALPIGWVAHADGQVLGTAALRVHDLEDRHDLTPWLGGVFVLPEYRRQGVASAFAGPWKKRRGRLDSRRCICLLTTSRCYMSASAGERWSVPCGAASKVILWSSAKCAMTTPKTTGTFPAPPDAISFGHVSIRIIERLGARFTDEVPVPPHDPHFQRGSRRKRRYQWRP